MVIIKNAIENIKTNKLRVASAMIWIVLGITSVVVLSSVGNGIEKRLSQSRENPDYRKIGMQFGGYIEEFENPDFFQPFTQEDVKLVSTVEGVERATPRYGSTSGGITHGTIIVSDYGDSFSKFIQYADDINLDIEYGRSFSLDDLERNTIIIDHYTAKGLFNNVAKSALGKSIDINGERFEVIGVTKKPKQTKKELEEGVYEEPKSYLPKQAIEQLAYNESLGGELNGIDLLVLPGYEPVEVLYNAIRVLEANKGLKVGSYHGTGDSGGASELGNMQHMINRFTGILTSVSLFIGGIGIMNIMYMSVAERQREIGIRRAIGAEPKDILIQFVIETVVITSIGGIIGMIVGTLAAKEVGAYFGFGAMASVDIYIKALVVSILTGVIFGAIPAAKAANLDPIKAIQG